MQVHVGIGLLFLLCWNLFPNTPNSYLYAAVIPLAVTLRVLAAGLKITNDKKIITSMTRGGTNVF